MYLANFPSLFSSHPHISSGFTFSSGLSPSPSCPFEASISTDVLVGSRVALLTYAQASDLLLLWPECLREWAGRLQNPEQNHGNCQHRAHPPILTPRGRYQPSPSTGNWTTEINKQDVLGSSSTLSELTAAQERLAPFLPRELSNFEPW